MDDCIARGAGLEILFHMRAVGRDGRISAESFALFLDYVSACQAAGTLTVLTPTQQLLAHPVSEE